MRLAFLALALTVPAASSALPAAAPAPAQQPAAGLQRLVQPAVPSRVCMDVRIRQTGAPEAARHKRLGELPPGDLTLAVVNRVGDCIEPATLRQGYGAMDSGPGR